MSDAINNENGVTQLASSVDTEPAEKSETLGVRTSRILLISCFANDENSPARAALGVESLPRLRGWLEKGEHTVSLTDPTQWQSALNAIQPDIVFIEASSQDQTAQIENCKAVKRLSPRRLVLAVLHPETAAQSWPQWRDAGADDYVGTDVSHGALEARMRLLTRMSAALRELDLARERLSRHTQVDETTQLLNRRSFFQNAHRECSRARRYNHPLACLMVDIDYLDELGKTFGYGCVEYVLRAVAYTVRQWTRDSDIAGRFSERKFVVLLPETDIEGATAVREKVLTALSETRFEWDNQQLPISVSIGESERVRDPSLMPGVAAASEPEESEETENSPEPISVREELASLLEGADAALNVARRASIRPGIFVQYTPGGESAE